MSLTTTKSISLDLYNNSYVSINAKQCDTESRYIEIPCTENGKRITFNLEDVKAFVRCKKADNTYVLNEAQITNSGNVLVELTQQMLAVPGKVQLDILLVDTSKLDFQITEHANFSALGTSLLSTMILNINVIASAIDGAKVESSNEYNALLYTITRMIAVEKELDRFQDELEVNESVRKSNEITRESNESTRKSNEVTRQNNEASRKNEETIRVNAENSRINAETSRVNAEAVRETNVTNMIDESTNKINKIISDCEKEISNKLDACDKTLAQAIDDCEKDISDKLDDCDKTLAQAIKDCETEVDNKLSSCDNQMNDKLEIMNTAINNANASATNADYATYNVNTAIANANAATERANAAAEQCEGIVDGTGFVMSAEKGVANGIATLDANTKIPSAQLPNMDDGTTIQETVDDIREDISALPQIHYGTSEPDDSLGKNGDIYMKILEA